MRKIDTNGIISRFAGGGALGFGGDGGPATLAQLNGPQGLVVDTAGDVIFCDFYNSRIRKIVNTVYTPPVQPVGAEVRVYPNPAGSSVNFEFTEPCAVTLNIVDLMGRVVRQVSSSTSNLVNVKYSRFGARYIPLPNHLQFRSKDREVRH